MGLSISFYGSSLVSAYWNGAATYYRGIVKNLARRGHKVTFFEPDAYDRQKHRDMADPDWAKVVVYEATPDGMSRAVEQGRNADVVVKASGVGVFDAELEAAVLSSRRADALAIFWDVDAPATLDRMRNDPLDSFRPLVPAYDAVFTYGGGQPVVDAYAAFGARLCVPVYNAVDPDTHHPVPPDPRFQADLGFVGNRLPDREKRVEEFFLKAASLAPGRQFLLGGAGWGDKPMPGNVRYHGHVYTADHNAFNRSCLAVLNVNRDSMASYGFSPPTRVFEAAGAGACLVTDRWEGIELFLDPGAEVLVADDGAAVAAHLEALTPDKARGIGEAARKRVLSAHTYAHRAAQVEALLAGADLRPSSLRLSA
ncbi:glycosyltransferase [Aerophototrophica crusticola]|uniref:Glycosyltransferase n=1 Tax=Aerophototrophica crusticola TaxID=1709002 RepID=A0A858RCI7_9PROT|nr:glycosyltransferase [Rhodospirillaceae bacterium B3]